MQRLKSALVLASSASLASSFAVQFPRQRRIRICEICTLYHAIHVTEERYEMTASLTKLIRSVCTFAIATLVLSASIALATETTWSLPEGGDWTTPDNWSDGVPNGEGHVAIFGPTAPASGAEIQLVSPVTVGTLTSDNPHNLILTGDNVITFDALDDVPVHVNLGPAAGNLSVNSDLAFPANDLAISIANLQSTLNLPGNLGITSSNVIMSGPGTLRLSGPSGDWSGQLILNSGVVEIDEWRALGNTTGTTVIDGGEVRLGGAVTETLAEPFFIYGGTLQLHPVSRAVDNVTLQGGSIRVMGDTSVDFLNAASTEGELHFAGHTQSDIILPEGNVAAGGSGFRLVGIGTSNPYFNRRIEGTITMTPTSDGNLQLAGRSATLEIASDLLAANNVRSVDVVEGIVALTGNNSFTGQTIIRAGTLLEATSPAARRGHGALADATLVEGRLEFRTGIPSSELLVLNGGELLGGGFDGTVLVQKDSTIIKGSYSGTIAGPANVTFAGEPNATRSVELNSANIYEGRTLITQPGDDEDFTVRVYDEEAFGVTNEPVVIAGGHVQLHVQPRHELLVHGGQIIPQQTEFDGKLRLRGGALVADQQTITVQSAVVLEGSTSELAPPSSGIKSVWIFRAASQAMVTSR